MQTTLTEQILIGNIRPPIVFTDNTDAIGPGEYANRQRTDIPWLRDLVDNTRQIARHSKDKHAQ